MGNRISIQFVDEEGCKSPILFSHWGGMELLDKVHIYLENLIEETKGKTTDPLDRLEAQTVLVDFIRFLTKDMNRVDSDLYLGLTTDDGDNSDNGHHIFFLQKSKNKYFKV